MKCKTCSIVMDKVSKRWGWKCDKCAQDYKNKWAKERRTKGLYNYSTRRKDYYKDYYSNPENRKRHYEALKRYQSKEENQLKIASRKITRNAIDSGRLKRKDCERCGNKKSEAHHPDYYQPLKVIWLCRKCHVEEHKIIRRKT